MVNDNKLNIIELLSTTDFSSKQLEYINYLLREYPYFQQAYLLKTVSLKKSNSLYKNVLQETAVRTIDRRILFDLLEHTDTISKKNVETQINHVVNEQNEKQQESVGEPVVKNENKTISSLIEEEKEVSENLLSISDKKDLSIKKTFTKKKIKKEKNKPEKLNYFEWIQQFKKEENIKNEKIFDAIDKFLQERPKIIPKKNVTVKPPSVIEKSVEERQLLMTETLANLYVKQKKYEKAIQAFKILSLKYPKKSSYFANQIKEIKKKIK